MVDPTQANDGPEIGNGTTFTVVVEMFPQGFVYVIVAVPGPVPITMPRPLLGKYAVKISLLLHVPPTTALERLIVDRKQIVGPPMIGALGLTVTVVVTYKPQVEYEITTVPVATPVTSPATKSTVAMVISLLLHNPLGVASVNVIVLPMQTKSLPTIAAGDGITVSVVVT
jgi:hypothetical protein